MYSCSTDFKNKLFIAYVYLNVRSSKKEFIKPLPYNYIGYSYNTFITINMLLIQDKRDDRKKHIPKIRQVGKPTVACR